MTLPLERKEKKTSFVSEACSFVSKLFVICFCLVVLKGKQDFGIREHANLN
jgi:hypothetical protein